MIDMKNLRANPDLYRTAAANKRFAVDIDKLLELDEQLREVKTQQEELQSERNAVSKKIGKASPDEREALKATVAKLKPELEALTAKVRELDEDLQEILLHVPEPPAEDVPIGKDDGDNVLVRTVGEKPQFDFKAKDHVEIGKGLDIIDIERGVKIAGSRSYILKGAGCELEHALLSYAFAKLVAKGYTPMSVPVLVSEEAMIGTGYFPLGRDQAYFVEKDKMSLIGTSEVPLVSYHSDEILAEEQLPLRYVAQSSCFRREAGTYGKDTHGLYRVHQFQKIEQVVLAPADAPLSEQLHDELLGNAEELMVDLELPYQVVYVCTGDLGQGQRRKHDIEAYMPSRDSYGETHSCSTFHDYQARRLKIRYRDKNKGKHLCYTLNNTAIATPRIFIPFLEVHQTKDGNVRIPEKLRPFLGGRELLVP